MILDTFQQPTKPVVERTVGIAGSLIRLTDRGTHPARQWVVGLGQHRDDPIHLQIGSSGAWTVPDTALRAGGFVGRYELASASREHGLFRELGAVALGRVVDMFDGYRPAVLAQPSVHGEVLFLVRP